MEKAERDGRNVLKVVSIEWHEFLTPQELEESKNMEF
jgi:hypothetical protein